MTVVNSSSEDRVTEATDFEIFKGHLILISNFQRALTLVGKMNMFTTYNYKDVSLTYAGDVYQIETCTK